MQAALNSDHQQDGVRSRCTKIAAMMPTTSMLLRSGRIIGPSLSNADRSSLMLEGVETPS
jgi:hypothetical protein